MPEILFQNENFVVCDKGPHVLSVPAREAFDPRPCLGLELQKLLGTQIFPVHRLDFDVGGLILYALNSKSHRVAQKWFVEKTIQKKYVAFTSTQNFSHWPDFIKTEKGALQLAPNVSFLWKTQMLRGTKRTYESAAGEWAETKAQVVKAKLDRVRWMLFPLTGKPHQLRFEMSRRGFPIWGDELYGSKVKWSQPGIALRAYELDLGRIEDRMGLPQKITTHNWDNL